MAEPLISLKSVRRDYPSGEGTISVLKHIDLTIEAGEMVAIVGASGSGKSTLMNILGCLDRPTSGSYSIRGRETGNLDADALSALRRENLGFIFQRYHLLAELTALGNVEIPAIYAGKTQGDRRHNAARLLGRLGMAERLDHRPGQLSGGQQQRVSIARALMNDAEIILADEPTGALDSASGDEVLRILGELHAEGRTVIIVTHDMSIARRAGRIIEISDGTIISDRRTDATPVPRDDAKPAAASGGSSSLAGLVSSLREALRMALLSMRAHKLRTFLTMLGIIIGIASVISVVALGQGSQQRVLQNISSLGTNTLEIFAGKDFGDIRSGKITTLVVSDAEALAKQSYVAAVTPTVSTSSTVRFGAKEANALVNGVSERYFVAKGTKLSQGRFFDGGSVAQKAQEVVIDENTRKSLFADFDGSPVGQVILIGKVPARIVGVTQAQQGGFGSSQNLSLYLPYTAVQSRFLGSLSLRSITVQVADDTDASIAEQAVTTLLTQRHGTRDFYILNTDDIRQTITSTTQTLTLLIAAIAVISLLVGGIGVMNIMLVSVSERVSEIGVRMAVGARRTDILRQFLIEAVLVCIIGGTLGVLGSLGFGALFSAFSSNFAMVYSTTSIVAAFVCSTLIGVVFGYLPARNASKLDPVAALSAG
ncbi:MULTISPECIES: MacB family efflux pump subunit [Rhizobium/Agrobacterium group]|uniref:MacB family efflux pump subunit n=1 Tax=Rhizobium/Agrobacterium group TaxID=227290 RepID=UPI000FD6F198|nr:MULTISPECIES: MacB family efflux pump subunit [Rhizobium/Agrobacterium group]MBB4404139.1 macrolide transport system ATP-binding/permease protein [Agrobacterium radiobacter]MBB5590291.1 macrolide transport system ATP-binding/permease protein [Agrobacterium radiobacter]RVT73778.1 MacB family efflux pump subunit [Agrobacterium sp. CNPSo 2736]TGE86766.1 macrolide ABC transporter permease/ATP-binding protein MacB [Rhizobium sp. SEMIA 4032]UXT20942.1 MacB family efflux pump subunit [Agrobacteriu